MNRKQRRPAKSLGVDIGETDVRFGGRTLQLIINLNTDEEQAVVLERVRIAARGPKKVMCVATIGLMPSDDASALWSKIVPAAEREAAKGSN